MLELTLHGAGQRIVQLRPSCGIRNPCGTKILVGYSPYSSYRWQGALPACYSGASGYEVTAFFIFQHHGVYQVCKMQNTDSQLVEVPLCLSIGKGIEEGHDDKLEYKYISH